MIWGKKRKSSQERQVPQEQPVIESGQVLWLWGERVGVANDDIFASTSSTRAMDLIELEGKWLLSPKATHQLLRIEYGGYLP